MEGSTWDQVVMYKLGNIEGKIDGITEKIDEHIVATENRFKPLESSNKKLSWLIGAGAGIGTIFGLVIEKVGLKWLNLF